MTYSDFYKQSVIDEAKATIQRVDKKLSEPQPQRSTSSDCRTDDKWKREAEESDAAREAHKQELGLVERTHNAVTRINAEMVQLQSEVERIKSDLLHSLKGINTFAEATYNKIEELSADVNSLKTKLAAIEGKSPLRNGDLVELPNPLRKRA
jgi:hypothetical protein